MTTINLTGTQEDDFAPDYRVFDLRGTHEDIGRQMGRVCPPFAIMPWWPPSPDRDFALDCAGITGDVHPPVLAEYRGFSDAQGLEYERFLQGICRTSLRQRAVGGCTSFACRRNGRVMVGRNYDFRMIQAVRFRVRLAPVAGLPSLGMQGSVPGGRYDGVNSRGLFVSLHVVMADDPPRRKPGVPFHVVPRILLESCADVDEAIEVITRMPHLNAFNYLLADPRRFVAIEAHPTRVRVVEPEGNSLVVANHYRHPDMTPLQGRRHPGGSMRRVDRARSLLEASACPASRIDAIDVLQPILADHTAPLCGHRPHNSTLWSLVADLGGRRIAYAAGKPCGSAFQTAAWPSA